MRDANARRQEISAENYAIYTSRLAFFQTGRRIEIVVSQELGRISVFGEFDVPFFTVNSKDQSGFTSFSIGRVQIGSVDYEVFTKDGIITSAQNRLLRSIELAELFSGHQFKRGEALHFYRNGLVLYARSEDMSGMLVHRMVALAEIIPTGNDAIELELPAQFADLETVLKDWGISDDMKRSDKIDDASEQELRRLLAVVEPRMGEINAYLSDPKENPESNATANLGWIIEAAMEAKTALVNRTAQNN